MNDSNRPIALRALQEHVGLRAPILFAGVILVTFGFTYSLLGTMIGALTFPKQAAGSLVHDGARVVGSEWVAQPFKDDRFFVARPSAANYDPMAAAGSNMARSNPDLQKRIASTIAEVAAREGVPPADVPADLATQSGSGLDPHISPAAARIQVARVARARGMTEDVVQAVVDRQTQGPQFGFLGPSRVDVLQLNLALDAAQR